MEYFQGQIYKLVEMSKSQTIRTQTNFTFSCLLTDRRAMNIVLLIRVFQLPVRILEHLDDTIQPLSFITPCFVITQQYQIVEYLIKEINRMELQASNHIKNQQGKLEKIRITQHFRNIEESEVIIMKQSHLWQKYDENKNLFYPELEQFYRYLFGYEMTSKFKYNHLKNKIKVAITNMDRDVQQNPHIYHYNYLNIFNAGKLFYLCKLVFHQQFWEEHPSINNIIQEITQIPTFQEIFGKLSYPKHQLKPTDFIQEGYKP